jgi:hypothetical protein
MNMKENYTMKSPDSGYHEPCLSPTEQHNAMVCTHFLFYLIIYLVEVLGFVDDAVLGKTAAVV